MNPRVLGIYIEAYKEKMKAQDRMNWYLGQYFYSAITTSLDQCFNGSKAKSEYIKKPIMEQEYYGLTDEEIQQKKLDKMIAQEMAWVQRDKDRHNKVELNK